MGDMAVAEKLLESMQTRANVASRGDSAAWRQAVASRFHPDLLDPAVRSLPIDSLAIAFALMDRCAQPRLDQGNGS